MDKRQKLTQIEAMRKTTHIAIIGGGLNGLVMAAAAKAAGLSVILFESQPKTRLEDASFDGRGYALTHGSMRMLNMLGLWEQLAPFAEPILDIKVSHQRGISGHAKALHFDHSELPEGPMGYMIEDRYFRRVMLDWVRDQSDITVHFDTRVNAVTYGASCAEVLLENNETYQAQLIIASDGRNSPTARAAGIRKHGWDYKQASLVCAIKHDRPHEGCARQIFTPSGPLAMLPLPDNQSAIVWTERRSRAHQLHEGEVETYLGALHALMGDLLGSISLTGKRYIYPLSIKIAGDFVRPRLALIGDAAHGIHPLAGQGLNLGLKDIAALAETLHDAKSRGEDIGDIAVLRRYQTWRRFDTQMMGLATNSVNAVFSNDFGALRIARDTGIGLTDAIPFLRRTMMRYAAGLSDDLPKLMQGRSL